MKKTILWNRTNKAKEILSLLLMFCSDVCFLFQTFFFIDFLSALVLLLYLSWTSNCDSFNPLVPSLTRDSVVSSVILLYCALEAIESWCIQKINFERPCMIYTVKGYESDAKKHMQGGCWLVFHRCFSLFRKKNKETLSRCLYWERIDRGYK